MEIGILEYNTPATIAPLFPPSPRPDPSGGVVGWLQGHVRGKMRWLDIGEDTTLGVSGGSTEFRCVGVLQDLGDFPRGAPLIRGDLENLVRTIPAKNMWGAARVSSKEFRSEAPHFYLERFVSYFHNEVMPDVAVVVVKEPPREAPQCFFDFSGVAYQAPSWWRFPSAPQTVRWSYRNRGKVEALLMSFPFLGALIALTEQTLTTLFGDGVEVALEVVRLPESGAPEELAVIVRSSLDIETGLERLERLEDIWLERARSISGGRFFFDIEFL